VRSGREEREKGKEREERGERAIYYLELCAMLKDTIGSYT